MTDSPPRQVLFVCTGNICRSPMAEHIFHHRMAEDPGWTAQSAGLFAGSGSPASQHAVDALGEWDIDLSPHRSQPVTAKLVERSDLILVMTEGHLYDMRMMHPQAADRSGLLTAFSSGPEHPSISDPIGLSVHVYRTVRDQINSAIADVILHIRQLG